jgi:uncharacterized protein YlbG (UPF0298 family)
MPDLVEHPIIDKAFLLNIKQTRSLSFTGVVYYTRVTQNITLVYVTCSTQQGVGTLLEKLMCRDASRPWASAYRVS